ncbi:clustered mitochondria protein homolog [Dendronephthya gigantea]|uniref:clustered mitochondria protein homolog n=1 Tax=Dendronephthya gigantea TaxID=151771 RepID=UPI00106D99AC|nr:clustered mitochondria protein homolog [Dendronephthya gigantea]
MPAVVSDLDTVPTKVESEKPQDKPVAKCPFDHSKPAEDVTKEIGVEANGNEKNGEDVKAEKKEDGKSSEQEIPPLYFMNLKLTVPGCNETITIQISSHETVQDIRQVVLDRQESCFRTCVSLYFDGKRLDDFAELHTIEGLKDESVIKVVEEQYSVREARIHVRRLRDLLSTSFESNALSAADNLSLSFSVAVSGVEVEEELVKVKRDTTNTVPTEECTPPDYVFPSEEQPLTLEALFPKSVAPKVPACVKELSLSSWNPTPGYRRLAGDLLYIDVITLEDDHVNVTSCPAGFYINRSQNGVFNPQPRAESCRSHTLVGLLSQLSPLFKKNFALLQKTSMRRHPLEVIPTPYQVFSWAIPKLDHTQDRMRAEDSSYVRIGHEEHMPGQLRDWNEELQSARELPRETLQQRLLRDRAIFKITSDFVMAATRGAMSVVDGNVLSINPGDDEKSRMYIWNNIFFSLAFDSRDHFKNVGGDEAAYAAAGADLKGVSSYNRVDIEGLYTLGTVVIDYRGYRVIAQSIIPGILQRDQENSVIYGSIDAGKTVTSNPEFLKLLGKAARVLRLRSQQVLNENDEETELLSSVECKGILGADGRHYILDLFRTFPTDVNFLEGVGSSLTTNAEEIFSFPSTYKTKLVSLRPELIESFIASRYVNFLRLVAKNVSIKSKVEENKNVIKKEETTENGDANIATSSEEESMAVEQNDKEEDMKGQQNGEERVSSDVVKDAAMAVGSLSETEFDVRFNPDAYNEEVRHAECEGTRLPKDKQLIQDTAAFLSHPVIATLIKDFFSLAQSPMDGETFTEILHTRGINIRYLGKIATCLAGRNDLEHVYKICISEMILRAAKKLFKDHMRQALQQNLATAVSHFLNCLLSSYPNPVPTIPNDETNHKKKKNKKNRNKQNSNNEVIWAKLTPSLLWSWIVTDIQKHFGFELKEGSIDEVISTYGLQPLSMLRSFCLKTGVQVLLSAYDFVSKRNPTFSEEHVMNIFPIVKHTNPKAVDAAALFEAAQNKLQSGFLSESHGIMVEALNLYHQVYGPLHGDIAVCYRQIARLYYMADDAIQAVLHQRKAVVVCERIYGIDHPDTIMAYLHLALYSHNAGLVSTALKLMYRARYLALVVFGEGHPDMATFDSNIGLVLQGQREFDLSIKFLENAALIQQKYHGPESIHTAMSFHLLARAKASAGDYRSALQSEKSAFNVYQKKFGNLDIRCQESSEFLKQLTKQAVQMQRKINELSGIGGRGTTAAEVTVPQGDREEISRLMGFISGLQDSPSRIKEQDEQQT